nr:MAG TPA: hypothetical protein [Caudoviricetes sp.]
MPSVLLSRHKNRPPAPVKASSGLKHNTGRHGLPHVAPIITNGSPKRKGQTI